MPALEDLGDSVFEADIRAHSQKPDCAYDLIERYYPKAPKIELFARQVRDGWACFGNEIEGTAKEVSA